MFSGASSSIESMEQREIAYVVTIDFPLIVLWHFPLPVPGSR
jgi:hypothetical protein